MITREQRDEWRKLADAATPGPWNHDGDSDCYTFVDDYRGFVSASDLTTIVRPGVANEKQEDDGRFIAAARTAVPSLLDALDAADAEIARLREIVEDVELEGCEGCHDGVDHKCVWGRARAYLASRDK